jgi:GDYXXLXY protein
MIRTSAASLAERWGRIPKLALFGAAALVQVALLTVMVIDRTRILREGTEVTLQTRPVDPRDLLRGDYVVLGYDISQLPAGSLLNQPAGERNPMVFVNSRPIATGSTRPSRYIPNP